MENGSPVGTDFNAGAGSPVAVPAVGQTAGQTAVQAAVQTAGRRSAVAVSKEPVVAAGLATLGFVLEVAMLAAFVYWGFRQDSPWHLILGIGIPAVLVVVWGVFLAPRSERRLKPAVVAWVALALFLLAAGALFAAGAVLWGTLLAVFSVGHFLGSRYVARQSK